MHCISPLKASLKNDGSITFNNKKAIDGLEPFQIVCRKCLPCRLNNAREKAIRAVHEARSHKNNAFLTLTYAEDHIGDSRLNYKHFQDFMRTLRRKQAEKLYKDTHKAGKQITMKEAREKSYISFMVTGEYGDKTKRPHWHALLFNYWPQDTKYLFMNKFGDNYYDSEELKKIWNMGHISLSELTFKSAGYVARYAAKKLTHGKDQEHDFDPIHKTSSRRAIGRSWIERHHRHAFENGFVTLPDGGITKIPRYYCNWLQQRSVKSHKEYTKEYEQLYFYYKFDVLPKIAKLSEDKQRKEELEFLTTLMNRPKGAKRPESRNKVKLRILERKFERLQKHLKL